METRARLTELDALRGIAALMVVVFHYSSAYPVFVPRASHLPFVFVWGHYGVQLFFAISGFVIFMTLDKTKQATDFVVSRFSRLFPAYWAAMIITTAVVQLTGPQELQVSAHDFTVNLTMLSAFSQADWVDRSYWTLSVELIFYGMMLALWRLDLLPNIERALAVWIALKWLWLFDLPDGDKLAFVILRDHIPFFALGIVGYRIWSGARSWFQQLPLGLFILGSVAYLDPLDIMIVWLLTAAMIALLVLGRLGFLNRAPLLWLGGISYTLYLLHQYIGYAVMAGLERAGVPVELGACVALALVLLLAHILTRIVERPALELIRRFWRVKREALALPKIFSAKG